MKSNCHCGSPKSYAECCQRLHKGGQAANPEELMRARYSAFVVKNIAYVRDTTDPQSILDFDLESTEEWANSCEFFQLEIVRATDEGNKGTVEFRAHFRPLKGEGGDQVHHEVSKFRKHGGIWYFRDGRLVNPNPPSGDRA